MVSALVRGKVLDDLSLHLYEFLPGQPHPMADAAISFPGVAAELGLSGCWPGGGKQKALRHMFDIVLSQHGNKFTVLLTRIVERGMTYRRTKTPITREEIEQLNALAAKLGYKAPDLHDPAFLDALPRATKQAPHAANVSVSSPDEKSLLALQDKHHTLSSMAPQPRGYAFEGFLNELFDLFGLAPRGSFRLVGEQIDGSFKTGPDVYLVEAKWQNIQVAEQTLLGFSGKVEGKAQWSRGLFVSYSGFTQDGLDAFSRGKRTSIICMDGLDLHYILQGKLNLIDVIDRKMRRAAETNNAFVSVRDLYPARFLV